MCHGQLINPQKCYIMFGPSCPAARQEEVRRVLQIPVAAFESKYLGLPTPEGHMHRGHFQNLQQRLTKRIMIWGDTLSQQAGKEVMIKAVAQALPTYLMGVFKLPFSVCDDLTRLVRNFWWGSKQGNRKMHWSSWDKLLEPKQRGGLGFRDFRLFNQALLARQAWRLIERPNSLCVTVLKARYYPNGSPVDTVFSRN